MSAVSLNKDTLAYQFGLRPAVRARSVAHVPTKDVIARINQFMKPGMIAPLLGLTKIIDYHFKGRPENDALIFYTMNHAMSVVRARKKPYEPLEQYMPLVDEYFNMLGIRTMRMFYYLFMICTREARHTPDSFAGSLWADIRKKQGKGFVDLIGSLHGMNPIEATNAIYASKPEGLLGDHVEGLVRVFNEGKWGSNPSFGGPNWGKIAEVLRDFVHGKITAEMMVDVAFTLEHNGGCIFNKGMMYEGNGPNMKMVLDVQRSGQVPQLIAEGAVADILPQIQAPEVQRVYKFCHGLVGKEFEGYVDWFKVKELGGPKVKSYTAQENLQVKKYGPPVKAKHIEEAKHILDIIAKKKAEEEVADMVGLIAVYPGEAVKKVERIHA